MLRRWLTWPGYEVTVIANVTDIDDKILTKSAEAGVPWFAHAYRYERELHDAYAALGCDAADVRAAGHRARAGDDRADRGADRARPRLPGRRRLRRRLLRRPVLAGVRLAVPAEDRRHGAGRRRRPARQARSPRLRAVEGPQAGRADHGLAGRRRGAAAGRAGTWSARRWPGSTSGDEFDIHGGGLDLRFPHHENELAQSTAAGQQFARFWMHNAWVTAAGEKMSKSLGNGALVSEVIKRLPGPRGPALSGRSRTTARRSSSPTTSLAEAAAALARIDSFVDPGHRAGRVDAAADRPGRPSPTAMNDDLGTPAAVAVLLRPVRDGNIALDAGDRRRGRAPARRGARHAGVLGPGRRRPGLGRPRTTTAQLDRGGRRAGRRAAQAARRRPGRARTSPPPTPSATPWPASASRSPTPRRVPAGPCDRAGTDACPVTANARAPSARASGKGNTAGSGGRVRRGLEGKGPTPKAEDRPVPRRVPARSSAAGASGPARRSGPRPRTGTTRVGPGVGGRPQRRAGGDGGRRSRSRPRTSPRAPNATTGCATSSSWPPTASTAAARGHPGRARPADRRGGAPGRGPAAAGVRVRPPRRPARRRRWTPDAGR